MKSGERGLFPATLALILPLLACARAQPASELTGTSWQLVEVQYMDDTVVHPDDGAKYALDFRSDGEVALRVDCNTGTGSFTSASPGQLVFGVFATTLASCPPGSLDSRFLKDLGYVRSYLLRDGRLYLSLMADGGIYAFAPAGAAQIAGSGPFVFRCAGLDGLVRVTYVSSDPPHARITRGDSAIVMRLARAASGAKYEGAEPGQLFWEHRGEAIYREGSAQPEVKCQREPSR